MSMIPGTTNWNKYLQSCELHLAIKKQILYR